MQSSAGDVEEEEEEEEEGLVHGRRRRKVQFMPSVGESCNFPFSGEARCVNNVMTVRQTLPTRSITVGTGSG